MKKLTVCVVTGSRAEFGIWRPVLQSMLSSQLLNVRLVVTGMHLLKRFGDTIRDISADGFTADAIVPMYLDEQPPDAARDLAQGITALAKAFYTLRADLVLVLGDRLEMFAAASAALAARIPIGHIHGGETAPGVWDEQIRHAITKMAHLHFCATETAKRRIASMGEPLARIHRVGAPAIDEGIQWKRKGGTTHTRKGAVLLLHPSGGDVATERQRCLLLLQVLRRLGLGFEVIGPNNDPGHSGILDAYNQLGINVSMNVSQEVYWDLLSNARVLIGNSSSGIIEAATFGIPVVNIGDRQAGRERNSNVIDVRWNARAIENAFKRAASKPFAKITARRKNLYGDGRASHRIVKVLEKIARNGGIPLEKRFVDS